MMGLTHSVTGAAAGLAVGLLAPSPVAGLACGAVGALFAYGPDGDHASSTATKALGPISTRIRRVKRMVGLRHHGKPLLCRIAQGMSRSVGLPAHRGITHTVAAAFVVGGLCTAFLATWRPIEVALLFGASAVAGWLAALAGDWATSSSLPHLWWPWLRETPGPPRWMRITTGRRVERWVVLPGACGLVVLGIVAVFGGVL